MKHTEKDILDKAKIVIEEACTHVGYQMGRVIFHEKERVHYGKYKGQILSTWVVTIEVISVLGKDYDTDDFITINDEDGEPLHYQTKHQTFEFEKTDNVYSLKL